MSAGLVSGITPGSHPISLSLTFLSLSPSLSLSLSLSRQIQIHNTNHVSYTWIGGVSAGFVSGIKSPGSRTPLLFSLLLSILELSGTKVYELQIRARL